MPEPLDGLSDVPVARRKRAFALAKLPGLGDFDKFFASPLQRSVTGPLRSGGLSETTKRVLENGLKVVEKISREGAEVPLSRNEAVAYESVVLIADRPALLVQNDRCAPAREPWTQPLSNGHKAISDRMPKVGRIEVRIGDAIREIGTGFVVGDGLVMTNRHVVDVIAFPTDPSRDKPAGDSPVKWRMRANLRPQINFKAEHQIADNSHIFPFTDDPAYTHPRFDLGLMRIAAQSSGDAPVQAPAPLKLCGTDPNAQSMKLYVVGYPAADNENAIPKEVLDDIFADVFEVKRLSPGELAGILDDGVRFVHDCSTLGGNSGSCVIDLNTELVVGIHFQGSYLKANYAIWIWKLKDFLAGQGVQFE